MMRSRRRSIAWLAAFAMALHSLWPLLAQARPQQAPELVALCTVDGTTHYIELPTGKAPAGEHSPTQHCKLCTFGADRAFVAPPVPLIALLEPVAVTDPHRAQPQASLASLRHPPAQPRAPPALS